MPFTRRGFLGIAVAGSVGLAGCGSDGGGDGGGGDESPTTPSATRSGTVVEMRSTSFDPLRASVEPGTTVEWVNEDGFDHDVTAEQFHDVAADWDFSEALAAGESTTYTFEEAGVYEYYCTIHGEENMCGAVLVGDVSLDQSLPCEDGGGGGGGPY
jgi:plastocyanin